jgi:hypothetical protein
MQRRSLVSQNDTEDEAMMVVKVRRRNPVHFFCWLK